MANYPNKSYCLRSQTGNGHYGQSEVRYVADPLSLLKTGHGSSLAYEMLCPAQAERDVYAAEIDGNVLMKIGPGDFAPDGSVWAPSEAGRSWAIWEKTR